MQAEIDLFHRAADYALSTLAMVDEGDLERATPCADWDVRTLLCHIADVGDALATFVGNGVLELTSCQPTGDEIAAAARSTKALVDALDVAAEAARLDVSSDSARTEWLRTAAGLSAVELAAHGWDVGTAIGRAQPVPDALAEALILTTASAITDDARGTNFVAAQAVGDAATPTDRLIAFLGRRPPSP